MSRHDQSMAALERANEIRSARTQFEREIKAGKRFVSELLATYPLPDCLRTMMPEKLLFAIPRFSRKLASQMLAEVPVSQTRNLGEMTYRQRQQLAKAMREWEGRRSKRAVPAHGSGVVRRSKSPRRVAS